MEIAAENRKKEDDSESISDDSVTESSDDSRSTSSDSRSSSDDCSSAQLCSPIRKAANALKKGASVGKSKPHLNVDDVSNLKKQGSKASEMEMMKERFAKLLLGEDMSGSGKGVSPALTISNAITNLCATVFGQLWRLEPLPSEKKSMWQRDMEWLLCVSDHIVELIPSWQTFPDGTRLEIMTCRPRSDLIVNLPALRKLDNMLLEILDGFRNTEFWYVDQGIEATIQRQEDKWWLPVPRVPDGGLSEVTRKQLFHKRDCAIQILKAATSINTIALADMEVPESYIETLPKNGRACLGDVIYRYITSEHFSSECLLDCLDISSEHSALEIANRVEAAIYVWHRRQHLKSPAHRNSSVSKSSWETVRGLVTYVDKSELFAGRAESLLLSLKQRFPGLTQTTLDATKIQCNKDVGKSILESYSRVLESLAFNIVARIEDLLYVDDITKESDKLDSNISHNRGPGTPYRTAYTTPNFSPAARLASPARGQRTPLHTKHASRGLGVKRALANYLGGEAKVKSGCGPTLECVVGSVGNRTNEL